MSWVSAGMELMMWGLRIIFVIVVVLLVVFAVNTHSTRDINIKAIEGDVILKRIFYSADCFAYEDARTHVGIIDIEKFNDERMKKCLNGDYYIKAELENYGRTAYNDEISYQQNSGFCKFENKY